MYATAMEKITCRWVYFALGYLADCENWMTLNLGQRNSRQADMKIWLMMNENGFHLFNIKLVLKAPDYGFTILAFLYEMNTIYRFKCHIILCVITSLERFWELFILLSQVYNFGIIWNFSFWCSELIFLATYFVFLLVCFIDIFY